MLVEIGTILKPRGLKGELKVGITYNHPEVFDALQQVYLNNQPYQVQKSSVQNGFAYLLLVGIDTIEKAEPFRNQVVAVPEEILALGEDEILSTTLIGFEVWHLNHKIGVVRSVENYGGGDFFEIAVVGKGFIQIPNQDDFIAETNMTNRRLVLTPNALNEEII